MLYANDIYMLHGRAPRGFSRFLLMSWAAMLVLLILAPALVDRLLWFPFAEFFSLTGFFLLPAVWGPSAAVQITGLLLASALFWFFGDDVQTRLGTRRFIAYLGITAAAGLFASIFWARLFSFGHAASVAPYLAWALAFAVCRLHAHRVLVWKRYALGRFSTLFYILLGALALNLLLFAAGNEPADQAIGALFAVAAAAFWFDPRWPRRLRAWWMLRRGRFGKHRGLWGY